MTTNYMRGTIDAQRYSQVEETAAGWIARQSDAAAPVWIIEVVDRDYLQGFQGAGCQVKTYRQNRSCLSRQRGR